MPVISNLVYTATDSTIVATWTTDTSSDSNLSAGGKAAIDNGVAANSTSHQAVVTGLSPSTVYSCVVTSGGTSSSPQNVTTSTAHTSTPITSVSFGTVTTTAPDGDIPYNFTSNDNNTYMMRDDARTPPGGSGSNQQLDIITNESTLAITQVNALSAYGLYSTNNGTDGPGGIALSNKGNGMFGMAGSLFMFTGRHEINGSTRRQFYGNVIRSDDKGVSWSNFNNPTTFNANGIPAYPNSGNNSVAPFFFGANSNWGWVTPVRYAADDGTLGYTTAGNGFDGGNAYCYFTIIEQVNDAADYIYLGRIPRIQLFALNYATTQQFWVGPTSPTPANFVNDANWSSTPSGLTKIYTNVGKVGWQDICFIPGINRYLLFSGYRPNVAVTSNTVWLVLEGETPAGPWTQVGSLTNNPSGYYGHTVLHRSAFSNALTQFIPITVVYSGDFNNQVPFYHPTFSTLTLITGGVVANTFVQAKGVAATQSGTTATLAYTSSVTSGNLLCMAWRYNGTGAVHLSSVTSTQTTGNWTIVYDQSDGGATPIQGGWAYAFATGTGACTVTMNFDTSVVGIYMAQDEWNGPVALRASSTAAVTNETALTSNAATAVAGNLQLGFTTMGAAVTNTITAGSGYNIRAIGLSAGGTHFVGTEDKLSSAGGSVTASFTSSENNATIKATVGLGIFTSVFTITGNAGVAGATVAWTGTSSGSVTADGSGNFNTGNLGVGSYTITPSLTGYTFTPTSSVQTITNANITGVNFTATVSTGGGSFDITFRGRLYITRVVSGL